jgi:hypothetical protein
MSADFWFWIGAVIVLVGGGGFVLVDRLEARRERRQHEADRQARLQREIRSSFASLTPRPRGNGRDRAVE